MIEIERKYRLNRTKIIPIVEKIPSSFLQQPSSTQLDEVFLINSTSFADFAPGDPVMRIRTDGETISLTYKKALEADEALEYEVIINSSREAKAILIELGYHSVTHIRKTRTEYKFANATIAIDDVMNLGYFIEIEAVCDDKSEKEIALTNIATLASALGLSEDDIETKKYDQLITQAAEKN